MKLSDYAMGFPHMGGVGISQWLREYAAAVPADQAIVETGCWLGGGTAQMALVAKCPIYVYDWWQASAAEVEKAARFGVKLKPKQDTLPMVEEALKPFGADITFAKGLIDQAKYDGPPIGLFVNDAGKKKLPRILKIFQKRFAPNAIVVLMDYHFKAGQSFPDGEMLDDWLAGTTAAVFRCYQ